MSSPAPEIRAVGAVTSGAAAITPGLPTGTVAGDLLLMFLETGGATAGTEANTEPTATGWTKLASEKKGNTRLTVLYKIAVGADERTTNDTGDHQAARIIGIQAGTFNPTSPFNAQAVSTQAATTAVVCPGLTTTMPNCLVFAACSGNLPDETSSTEFSAQENASLESVTERIDNARASGDGGALMVASGVKVAAGAVSETKATAVTEAERAVMTIAVNPIPLSATLTAATEKDSAAGTIANIGTQLAAAPVSHSLLSSSQPAALTLIPWASTAGSWSATNGWSPPTFVKTEPTGDRGGLYLNTTTLKGGAGYTILRRNNKFSELLERQLSVYLFSEMGEKASGYHCTAYQAVEGEKDLFTFKLRKWVAGTPTLLEEVASVTIESTGSFAVVAAAGKVSMWVRQSSSAEWQRVGAEVSDTTFTEGRSGFAGNGSNPAMKDFATGTLTIDNPALTLTRSLKITSASETDASVALVYQKPIHVVCTPASATDTAQVLALLKALTMQAATEFDETTTLTLRKFASLLPASELDLGQALNVQKFAALAPATEADTAQALNTTRLSTLTAATEFDSALALTLTKSISLGTASEKDLSATLIVSKLSPLAPAAEIDSAVNLVFALHPVLTPAEEVDEAIALALELVAIAAELALGDFAQTIVLIVDGAETGVSIADAAETVLSVSDYV